MAGVIVGVLLGLCLLVFFIPVVVSFSVTGQAVAFRVYVLGLPLFRLQGETLADLQEQFKKRLPKRKSKRGGSTQKKKPKAEKVEKEDIKEKKQRTVSDYIELVRWLAASASASVRLLLRFVLVYDVQMMLPVQGANACLTAQKYGKMQAFLGAARAAVSNVVHLRIRKMVVLADFAGQSPPVEFSAKVALSPAALVLFLLYALWYTLKTNPALARKKRRRHIQKLIRQKEKQHGKQPRASHQRPHGRHPG